MSSHRPKILLLGGNGQVGWELQRALAPVGDLIAYDRAQCDLANTGTLREIFNATAPNVVVNAAAYTAVDKAEQDAIAADRINHEAVSVLADCARQNNALLVHYSTDYVFDGTKSDAYDEQDNTNPLSVYGSTKLKGEQAITASACEHLIFRTSWVFAARGANFAKTILKLARERESLNIVSDQFGAPTSAELIADITAHAIREALANRAESGIYHLAASGKTSWHAYAQFVIEQANALGTTFKLKNLNPVSTDEYPLPARRPANSCLDTSKLRDTFNVSLPGWDYYVRRMLIELLGK